MLGNASNNAIDPFVTVAIRLPTSRPSFSTEVVKKTSRPVWRSTYLLSMHSNHTIFELTLSDHRILLPDTPLGQCFLDVATLKPDVIVDAWLPLGPVRAKASASEIVSAPLLDGPPHDKEDGNTVGYIHLNLQLQPVKEAMDPSDVLMMPLSRLRFVLEKDVYFPGETVRGSVILDLPTPTKVYGVNLTLEGQTKVFWWSEGRKAALPFSSSLVFFEHSSMLLGDAPSNSKTVTEVDSGTHVWPFEYVLPPALPSNVAGEESWTRYSAVAVLLSPWTINNQRAEATWKVATCYSLQLLESRLQENIQLLNMQRKVTAEQNANKTIVEVEAPHVAYLLERVPLDLTIDNTNGIKEVKDVRVDWKVLRCVTGVSLIGAQWQTLPLTETEPAQADHLPQPVAPGRVWSGTIYVSVPAHASATVTKEQNPIYQVFYALSVQLITAGLFDAPIQCTFPIVLSFRPRRSGSIVEPSIPAKPYIHDAETDDEAAHADVLEPPVAGSQSTPSSDLHPCPYTPPFYLPDGTKEVTALSAESLGSGRINGPHRLDGKLLVANPPSDLRCLIPSPHYLIDRTAAYGASTPPEQFRESEPKELANLAAK